MKFIGLKLKELREAKKMSMTDLKNITGIEQGYISQIENGKRNPSAEVVNKFCKALGVNELYFYIEESMLPQEYLVNMPEEISQFVLQGDNVPWIAVTKEAKEKGLSLETMKKIIEILSTEKDR